MSEYEQARENFEREIKERLLIRSSFAYLILTAISTSTLTPEDTLKEIEQICNNVIQNVDAGKTD